MPTSKDTLAQVAKTKKLGSISYRQTHVDTGYTSELYLGHQVYYSERQTHISEARADEDAAGVALHYLHLLATDAHVDVNTQLCLPLQGLTLHSPLEGTDGSDVNHTPTCSHVSKAVTSSCGKGSMNGNSKSRCIELLSQLKSPPPSYNVSLVASGGRFQAKVKFQLPCVAKSGDGVKGKKKAEHMAAEEALKQLLKVPLGGSTAKSALIEWTQTERIQVPQYYSYNADQGDGVYCAVVYCSRLSAYNVSFELAGSVCASAPEAELSAAERVIAMIDGLQLIEGFRLQSSSSPLKTGHEPGQKVENCYDKLCRHCQQLQLPVPTVKILPSAGGDDCVVVNMFYRFSEKPPRTHTTKKDAEKSVAQYVLTTAFPCSTPPEADQCKNRLQEICQKLSAPSMPRYETVPTDDGRLYNSTVTVPLEYKQACGKEHKNARHVVAMMILMQLGIDV